MILQQSNNDFRTESNEFYVIATFPILQQKF